MQSGDAPTYALSNDVLSLLADMDLLREEHVVGPIDDLLVRIPRIFGAEWCISNETFIHDCTKGPPVTFFAISLQQKYLGSDVVGCSYS